MIIKNHHSWNLNYKNAVEIQKKLRKKIILYDDINPVKRIAGVDVKFLKNSNLILGAVLIFSFPDLTLIETKTCKSKTDFPYIPVNKNGYIKIKNITNPIIQCWTCNQPEATRVLNC